MIDGYQILKGIRGVECQHCLKFIYSVHESDSMACRCGSVGVEGGQEDMEVIKENRFINLQFKIYDILINTETGYRTLLPAEGEDYA